MFRPAPNILNNILNEIKGPASNNNHDDELDTRADWNFHSRGSESTNDDFNKKKEIILHDHELYEKNLENQRISAAERQHKDLEAKLEERKQKKSEVM